MFEQPKKLAPELHIRSSAANHYAQSTEQATEMKPKVILCLALVWGDMAFSTAVAQAQPGGGTTFRSLETRILQAPAVFRVTLTNARETVTHTNSEHGPYDFFGYAVTFRVDEVLKGNMPNKSIQFDMNHLARWEELVKWADEQGSFLWFWNDFVKDVGEDFHGNFSERVIFLGRPQPARHEAGGREAFGVLYDMDMTLLTTPEDILSRARAFTKKGGETTHFHSIYLREHSSDDHCFSRSFLVVPVLPALERTAKHLISAPEDFMTARHKAVPASEWRCDLRAGGAEALRYFKSAQNVELLKSLLDARDCWLARDWSTENRDRHVTNKIYGVRDTAYVVLKGWGVEVAKPVTLEALPAAAHKQ